VVDQADVNFVGQGQKVRLQADEAPGHVLTGTIVELANLDLKVVPRELAKGTDVAVQIDEKGVPHPRTTSYQARIELDDVADAPMLPGTRGRAKIAVPPQSLGERLLRFVEQTFNVRS
jgi:hypothetical protein